MQKTNKKIWILLPSLNIGGAEVFLTSLATILGEQHDFVFFLNSKTSEISEKNFKIITHLNLAHFVFNIVKKSWEEQPDIILSSIIDINIISLALKPFTPKTTKHIIREALPLDEAVSLSRFPSIHRWLAQRTYPRADAIVSLSNYLMHQLKDRLPPHARQPSHVVISNGVSPERIKPALPETQTKKIVAIGRLEHQKGFDILIKAFSTFQSRFPEYHLLIIGEGSQREALERIIKQYSSPGAIQLIGKLNDPIEELASASLFVLSSRYEGVSNAMLEALANGVPVLATRQKTSAEEFVDGSNGILVERCCEDDLISGFIKADYLLTNFSRREIAKNTQRKYRIENSAKLFNDLFVQL